MRMTLAILFGIGIGGIATFAMLSHRYFLIPIVRRVLVLALLLVPATTYATPLTLTLEDVAFDDGGTASGWFTYFDVPGDTLEVMRNGTGYDWLVNVSGGGTSDLTYSKANGGGLGILQAFTLLQGGPHFEPNRNRFDRVLSFSWDTMTRQTPDGALLPLLIVAPGLSTEVDNPGQLTRYVTRGGLRVAGDADFLVDRLDREVATSVPEPSSLLMLSLASGGLALIRRRRSTNV